MLKWKKLLANVPRLTRQVRTTSRLTSDELVTHRDTLDNNPVTPFDFSDANLIRLAALIRNYPEGCQRSAIASAMDIVQRQMGWIPISAMHKVAELLSIPRIRVYEWATFYTMCKRHYRGKYHVKVCSTTPCMLRGSECILQAAEEACNCCVGDVSMDGMFGVDIVECAGACVNAPVLVIDDDYYEDVTEVDVFNIIQQIRNGCIPRPGPQNGRFAAEPITGFTTLLEPPPPPGFGLQEDFRIKRNYSDPCGPPCPPKFPDPCAPPRCPN